MQQCIKNTFFEHTALKLITFVRKFFQFYLKFFDKKKVENRGKIFEPKLSILMSYVQKIDFRYTVPFNFLEFLAIYCCYNKQRALAESLRIRQVTGKIGLIKQ